VELLGDVVIVLAEAVAVVL
jgi:hypothetical protein